MKKKYFWLAAMAVTVSMASCSLEEVVEQPAPQAIGFSPFVGKPTKAVTETTVGVLQGADVGFKVWGGYKDDANVFDGRKVTWSSSAWGYTGIEYWVPGKTYKFAAVGPAGVFGSDAAIQSEDTPAGTNASFAYNGGHLSFNYLLTDLTESVDVVYAESGDVSADTETGAGGDGTVDFTFGHIMSWIKIKFVHKMTTGYKITVSDVTVTGVQTGATFTGSGTSTGTWDWNESVDETVTKTDATFTDQDPSSNLLDTEGDNCMVDFIAIPQEISNFTISFNLKVQDSQNNDLLGSGGKQFSTTLNGDQTWAVNNVYVYTANLTADVLGLKPIKFDVTNVAGWPTSGDGYHNNDVPKPTTQSN